MGEGIYTKTQELMESFKRLEVLTTAFQGHIKEAREIQEKLIDAGHKPGELVFLMNPDDALEVTGMLAQPFIMGIKIEPSLHIQPGLIYLVERNEISPEG